MFNQKKYEILNNMDGIKGMTLQEYWERRQNLEYKRFCFIKGYDEEV
jgi:hypothetical protein